MQYHPILSLLFPILHFFSLYSLLEKLLPPPAPAKPFKS